jgi:acetylornithine deacetylase/succinyl-diaminopimelate desuccinylase-like protein
LFVGGPEPRKQNVVIRLRGRGEGKPILLLAHLDVVEANKEDWSQGIDPFQFTEKDGYFYGRGTQDIKEGATMLAVNMIRWKQEGWKPSRDLILALTADEEGGSANGVSWLLNNHRDVIEAEYCINTDAGDFDERKGNPYHVSVSAAEKKYSAIYLQTTNRGGHGSLPRTDNAIYELANALEHVANYRFPVDLSDITREELIRESALNTGQRAADMKAVAANPKDHAAADRLSQDPRVNAILRTTCAATQIEGGHAQNALPQRAKAVLNCRILPQEDPEKVLAQIKQAVSDPQVEIGWATLDPKPYPPSPMNKQLFDVVEKVVLEKWPDVKVTPFMDLGASDGKFLRGAGIPTYGVAGVFIEDGDVRSHGKDERIGVQEFYDGVDFYNNFMKALVK